MGAKGVAPRATTHEGRPLHRFGRRPERMDVWPRRRRQIVPRPRRHGTSAHRRGPIFPRTRTETVRCRPEWVSGRGVGGGCKLLLRRFLLSRVFECARSDAPFARDLCRSLVREGWWTHGMTLMCACIRPWAQCTMPGRRSTTGLTRSNEHVQRDARDCSRESSVCVASRDQRARWVLKAGTTAGCPGLVTHGSCRGDRVAVAPVLFPFRRSAVPRSLAP